MLPNTIPWDVFLNTLPRVWFLGLPKASKLDHKGSYWEKQASLGSVLLTVRVLGAVWDIWCHLGSCRAIWVHAGPFWAILGQFGAILGQLETPVDLRKGFRGV